MALVTYPLNNIDYSAEDAELYHCTRTSGVFAADEDFSATVTGADNIVNIGQGIAWIRNSRFSGKVVANKSATTIDMGLADGTYARIDAIVLRFDANKNTTEIVKKEGVASSSPVAPEVVRTESVYELHLYHVRRRGGATSILASDITDLRHDRQYCGVMVDDVTMYGDEYVKRDEVGSANGVASLDASGKVPSAQLPSMNYIPTSQKGAKNGVLPLDADAKIPNSYYATVRRTAKIYSTEDVEVDSNFNTADISTIGRLAIVGLDIDFEVTSRDLTTTLTINKPSNVPLPFGDSNVGFVFARMVEEDKLVHCLVRLRGNTIEFETVDGHGFVYNNKYQIRGQLCYLI